MPEEEKKELTLTSQCKNRRWNDRQNETVAELNREITRKTLSHHARRRSFNSFFWRRGRKPGVSVPNSTEFQIVMYFLFAQKLLLLKTLFIKMLSITNPQFLDSLSHETMLT